jgi:putative Holliday junction resolvase
MRYLGIDFGKKRVGLALSDEAGEFALPYDVLPNTYHLLDEIIAICENESVGAVVLGESRNFKGKPNAVMKDALAFKDALEVALGKLSERTGRDIDIGIPVHLEPEFMTSAEAQHVQTELGGTSKGLDASAAALILKSYLDKKSHLEKVSDK